MVTLIKEYPYTTIAVVVTVALVAWIIYEVITAPTMPDDYE